MFSERTKLSLAQFLEIQKQEFVVVLLDKHGMDSWNVSITTEYLKDLVFTLQRADAAQLSSLLGEIARTQGDLRARISPRHRYDERLHDLKTCLMLDGYLLDYGKFVPLDPSISDGLSMEDDLSRELKASGLPASFEVTQKLEQSAQAFRSSSPNYNSSLNDARVALQSLATGIAQARPSSYLSSVDFTKWGSVIAYLYKIDFITHEEQRGLVGVFGFVSPGSHRPLGLSEQEYARLGRSFVAGMCWFLVKRHLAMA